MITAHACLPLTGQTGNVYVSMATSLSTPPVFKYQSLSLKIRVLLLEYLQPTESCLSAKLPPKIQKTISSLEMV